MHHRITVCVVVLAALGARFGGADQLEQELSFALQLAERLGRCYVPEPSLAGVTP